MARADGSWQHGLGIRGVLLNCFGAWEDNKFSTNLYTTVDVIPCSRKASGQVKQGITQDKAPKQFNNKPLVLLILYCHTTRTKRDTMTPAKTAAHTRNERRPLSS